MKDLKTWISVSVEKELPKEDGLYVFGGTAKLSIGENELGLKEYMDVINFKTEKKHNSSDFDIYEYYLKPFSLPELMEEAIREYIKYLSGYLGSEGVEYISQQQFVNDFLTQKGIL